jgi:hypothetical protein
MIALAEEKATPNEFARIAWSDLYDYLRTACDRLNAEGSYEGLRIGSSDALRLERPTREQVNVLYLLGSGKAALLKITFDFDLLYLRYTVPSAKAMPTVFRHANAPSRLPMRLAARCCST